MQDTDMLIDIGIVAIFDRFGDARIPLVAVAGLAMLELLDEVIAAGGAAGVVVVVVVMSSCLLIGYGVVIVARHDEW